MLNHFLISRFSYKGKVAKHRIEVKKAVFVETNTKVRILFFSFVFLPYREQVQYTLQIINLQNISHLMRLSIEKQ